MCMYLSVLLYSLFQFIGAGSKNALLELYRKELSSLGENTFIVDGFKEESTARAILQALCDHLNIKVCRLMFFFDKVEYI